jgi:periplasmic protein TonB
MITKHFFTHFVVIALLHSLLFLGWQLNQQLQKSPPPRGFLVSLKQQHLSQKPSTPVPVVKNPSRKLPPLEKLVSSEVAAPKTSESTAQRPEATSSGNMRDLYMQEIRSKIEANKFYPTVSRRMGQTGIVVVAFTLLKDGSIMDLHVHKSSQFERLDASAMEAVKKVGRFNPIPHEVGETQLDITVPLKFYL